MTPTLPRLHPRLRFLGLRPSLCALAGFVVASLGGAGVSQVLAQVPAQVPAQASGPASAASAACVADPALTLPAGFCAQVFAQGLGHVRHLALSADGTLYANSQSGYEDTDKAAGLIILRDKDGDGRAEQILRPIAGQQGGTGVALYKGAVYLENGARIMRHALDASGLPAATGEEVITNLATSGDHVSHSIQIAPDGTLYVNSGSATNACQQENRKAGSRGVAGCPEKQLRAGIWRYSADQTGQIFSPAARYATGIRNAVGLALDSKGALFATQHGRDQLHENWGALYTAEQSQNLPAEELVSVRQGDDFGWPECYYDPKAKALVLAPEYGGNGGKAIGLCATRKAPVAAFPAHWAPNALTIYEGQQFPEAYRGGAFIAFHGSWNRAPGPQDGFNVVFQPLRDGVASGAYTIFADGFAGAGKARGDAKYRPSGLAVGPDGALYIGDDKGGRIWKVTYQGGNVASAQPASAKSAASAPAAKPAAPKLALPKGVTAASIALGQKVYEGKLGGATCAGCHGSAGQGTALAPRLNDSQWLWSDGSPAAIRATIISGVAKPKRYPAPMPAYGGVKLDDKAVSALAAYVWSMSQAKSAQ